MSDEAKPDDAPQTAAQTGGIPGETEPGQGVAPPDPPAGDRPLDPEKLLRLASMAGQILEEARNLDTNDEGTAKELAALHDRVTAQLYDALPNALVEELKAMELNQPFEDGATGQEVRLAYAGLTGWLGGLFQGLQAAMQMAHMQQIQQARQTAGIPQPGVGTATGQYL